MLDRIPLVDAIKGLAILMVVLGHSIQAHIENYDEYWAYRLIYSFHMPLFMALSGYVTKVSLSMDYIVGKFNRLVVPFLCWYGIAFFWQPIEGGLNLFQYITRLIKAPDYGLWFLWVLFLCHLCLWVSCRIIIRQKSHPFIMGILLIGMLPMTKFMGLHFLKWYYIFFLSGYFIAKHGDALNRFKVSLAAIAIVAFPISLPFWHRTRMPLFSRWLPESIFNGTIPYIATIINYSFKLMVAAMGIVFVYVVMRRTCNNRSFCNFFCWFGRLSLEIYVSHQSLLFFSFDEGAVKIGSATLFAIVFSLGIALLFKQIPLLSYCLYGGRGAKT